MLNTLLKFLLPLILFAQSVFAIPYGQDYLGGAKFQKEILANHDYSQGAGMFAITFGDSLPLATALANRAIPFLRIQLAWQDNHIFLESQFSDIGKQAKRFCPLASKTKLYLSGACEHNLDSAKANKLASIVLAACPQATYVNTPWRGAVLPQYINESHGTDGPKSPKSSYSSDGKPSEDIDIEKLKSRFANAQFFMFWSPRYNGRWEDNDSTPRPQRKGYADGKMIKSMLALAKPKGATSLPPDCKKVLNKQTNKLEDKCIPTKWLYKSHSENKGTPDPRAEKPVIIAPVKAREIKVGEHTFRYYDVYNDGRHRYYASKWGYEIATTPMLVTLNNKQIGTINPSFRDGQYR